MKTRRDFVRLPVLSVLLAGALFAVGAAVVPAAQAQTFKFANQGDALSMDPHSLNESFQLAFTGNIYEPLIGRGKKLEVVPALATDWKQTSPTVWRFNLRKNVKFHDGTPFTADDVIFSYERAKADGSDVKTYVGPIKEIRKIDDHTIDIVTNEPFPILPDVVTNWYIMSKKWCEENQRHAAGRQAQGRREHGVVQGQRHRPVPPALARAEHPHHAAAQPDLLGQDRRQRPGSGLHADRQPVDARGRAAVGRDRHDGAGAGAGRRAHQRQPGPQGDAGARAAHDLPRHGPVAQRTAVLERQGQEPVQGQAGAPGVLPGDRRQRDPEVGDARRVRADRPDDRARASPASRRT